MYNPLELTGFKRHWLMKSSNIPSRFLGHEPADIIEKTGIFSTVIEEWLEDVLAGKVIKSIGGLGITGVGLLLDGDPGLGKSTHAVTTIMELIRRLPDDETTTRNIFQVSADNFGPNFRPVYYMTYPEFLSRKKAMFDADPETKARMFEEMEGFHGRSKEDRLNVRVLVLDDLGKEYKGSGFNDASFDEILRSRYDKALPTIVTTNVDRSKWAAQYGDAMGSFAHEAFHRVVIKGQDLRKG